MRVLTWNVWWRFGPWEQRQKAILGVLRDLRPDVIRLQEVWAGGGENLARWLAQELGMQWTWALRKRPSGGGTKRDILCGALTRAGLVNCPTEWWHWSFGDRYWALATGAAAALHGPRTLD